MILRKADLQYLKWPLLLLFSVLCIGSAAMVAGRDFAAHARDEQQAVRRRLDEARATLAAAGEDRKNMESYMREYGELLRRGVIGEGRRLDWIEDMEKIRQQHRVLDFAYSLSRQHPFTWKTRTGRGRFGLNMSDMVLRLELLHEGQLMDFLGKLHSAARGKFILHDCTLKRVDEADVAARLRASCTGGWLTLSSRGAA